MPLDLARSLTWTTAAGDDLTLLDELQPHILRPHVREHLAILFLRFDGRPTAAAFLGALVALMKSARTHLEEVEAFRVDGTPGSPYVGIGLTADGYAVLEVPEAKRPADARFRAGMKASRSALHDPPVAVWEPPYREDVHAVVLVGDATDAAMTARLNEVLDLVPDAGVTVVGQETGRGQHNAAGDGIEHFGYVDGRSQPLFLTEDVAKEAAETVGPTAWDPRFDLDRVIVPDRGAPDPGLHHGSYFVFRKLEQDVRRFKEAEQALADELGLVGDDRERAGAMLVGRFEDGTPVTTDRTAGAPLPVTNNFTYAADDRGARCPFAAHIRVTNPRGSGGFGQSEEQERRHLMPRRGQTYGERLDDPNGDVPPSARPTGGVGLLFMAFNADIAQQFEFTQETWANNPGFPEVPADRTAPGLDPVIGQGPRPPTPVCPIWGADGERAAAPAAQAVTLKGGEYFFMPSLAFLRGL